MKKLIILAILTMLLSAFGSTADGQISSGGNYALNQSVIASGGGQNSAGGAFALDGTIGQAVAGQPASGSTFNVRAGFWTPQNVPTAAGAIISGSVRTSRGRGIMNAVVSLTGADGVERRTRTVSFGYFHFDDVASGQTYILTVTAKRFTFENPTQVVSVFESLDDINFTAVEP